MWYIHIAIKAACPAFWDVTDSSLPSRVAAFILLEFLITSFLIIVSSHATSFMRLSPAVQVELISPGFVFL